MSEHGSEYIAALAESYRADPNPDNARRLWEAVLGLEGWYVILRGEPSQPTPFCGLLEGRSFIAVWTDAGTLNEYIDHSGMQPITGEEIQYMLVPLPEAIDYLLSFEDAALDGIRFNLPKGWSVSFGTLRNVARFFGMGQ
jgi:hypothetical protein